MITLTKRFTITFVSGLVSMVLASPAFAGDPFRPQAPHDIGADTEAAFLAIFREGNYQSAQALLNRAIETEPNEPLAFAMMASFAYDANDFDAMKRYAQKTREAAEALKSKDPLRGNLYLAVGHFLDGSYLLKQGNYIEAVSKVGDVFEYLDIATATNPKDPELNLMRGYLDLFLSKYTPFSESDQVIKRFQEYASPPYLKHRALATTYRDLKQYDKAMEYLDKAIAETPNNPELQYLKGQFHRINGRNNKDITQLQIAQAHYQTALKKQNQLSRSLIIQLNHENNAIQHEIQKLMDNPNLAAF